MVGSRPEGWHYTCSRGLAFDPRSRRCQAALRQRLRVVPAFRRAGRGATRQRRVGHWSWYHRRLVAMHRFTHAHRRAGAAIALLAALAGASRPLATAAQDPRRAQSGTLHDEITPVALQPLAQQVRRVESVLASLGQPLSADAHQALNGAIGERDETRAVRLIDDALAPLVLLDVTINPESRVSVVQG